MEIFKKQFDVEILYAWLHEGEKKIDPDRELITIFK